MSSSSEPRPVLARVPANDVTRARQFWERRYAEIKDRPEKGPWRDLTPLICGLQQHGCRSVLDLGCGTGRLALALARAGFHVTAADISETAVRLLEARAHEQGVDLSTRVSPAEELSRSWGSFDAVVCNSVLDHMPLRYASAVVRSIRDVLNENGVAYISFDGREGDSRGRFKLLRDGTRRYVAGERKGMLWRFYSDEEIRGLCDGMEIQQLVQRENGTREVWVLKDRKPGRPTA